MTTTRTSCPEELTMTDVAAMLPEDSFRRQTVKPYTREEHEADLAVSPFREFGPCRCTQFCAIR
jgi:hypothetical protein